MEFAGVHSLSSASLSFGASAIPLKETLQQMSSSEETVIGAVSGDTSTFAESRTPLANALKASSSEDGEVEQKIYVSSNGLQFKSVDEVLSALSAALEVNEHMRQQVEEKGSLALSLGAQMEACESRYQKLLDRVRDLERQVASESKDDDGTQEGKKMTALLKQGTRTPTKGFWESDMVSKKRKELLEKGAHQGWLMNVNELQIGAPIGQGSFGQTFEANWRGTRVAVKSAMAPDTSAEALNVLREIECFSSIKHPNVLPFLGACLSDSERCLLVTEYMSGGNLKDWIHGLPGARKPHRKLSDRLRMALHVAQGMAGLEGEDPPIVHRDLKPSNVFVDGAGAARVADMNLSLRLNEDSLALLTGETGTYLYMSPEMMRHEMYTTKTDVWSFGVSLVELCNQQVPYSNLFLTPLQVAIGVADRGLRPSIEATDIPIPVKQIIDACLAQDPFQRPNFVALVAQLKPIVAAVAAAETRAEAAPSLLSRVSQGLGMLQGVTGQAPGAAGGSRNGMSGSRNGGAPLGGGVRVKPVSQTGGSSGTSPPRTPKMARSNSQGSRGGSSSALPPPGQRPSIGGGINLPGLGALGGGSGNGSGAAQAIAGGAQAAAGKASAMFSGFMNRNRPSPRR